MALSFSATRAVATQPLAPCHAPHDQRRALIFLAVFTAYWPLAGACDALGGLPVQYAIGTLTWLFLAVALWTAPQELRVAALAMVVVATGCEIIGSLVWGVYRYRYDNLPLYVPPGHGLFYLAALRLAVLPLVRRHSQAVVRSVAVVSALWVLHGLLARPQADLLGVWCWLVFAGALWRGCPPVLFALTFTLTMVLEFYGTALGAWHWAAIVPGLGVSAGNPPAAIGAGYCIFDALARKLAHRACRRRHGVMTDVGNTDVLHTAVRGPSIPGDTDRSLDHERSDVRRAVCAESRKIQYCSPDRTAVPRTPLRRPHVSRYNACTGGYDTVQQASSQPRVLSPAHSCEICSLRSRHRHE